MAIPELLPMEIVLGDTAGSSIDLTSGAPADRIHISASLTLNEKVCF